MKDGAYNYYLPNVKKPMVVEVEGDWVWLAGDGERMLLEKCHGRFVALVELPDIRELEAWWPALPDLQGGLDLFSDYPISGEVTS